MAAKNLNFERILDLDAMHLSCDAIAAQFGDPSSLQARNAVFTKVKSTLTDARAIIAAMLREDGSGLLCARRLSQLQDEIIRAIFGFATKHVYPVENPSTSEHVALVAVGGYGRQTLAPGSDVDLLFILPYKPTPWTEQIVEYVLYMLWDMGFKVGHATRNIDECIRLSLSDMTIRTALLDARFICGTKALLEGMEKRFASDILRNTAREFIAAKLAERDVRHRKLVIPAILWNRTSRKERAGCGTCKPFSGLPGTTMGYARFVNWSNWVCSRGAKQRCSRNPRIFCGLCDAICIS